MKTTTSMTDVEEGPNSQRTKITGDHGNVQLRDPVTNQLILIPPPSEDPKDPLNWSRGFRLFIAFIANTAVFLAQLISAGPSVNIMNMVHDLFNATPTHPKYPTLVAKVSYFFSGMVFLQSMSNLFYMPVIIKYGRRPVYIVSLLVFGAYSLWAGLAKSYPSELAARLTLGFAGGSADSLAPLTITDIFFLHERGFIMSFYATAVSCGIGSGIVLCGLISIHSSWRVIYFVVAAAAWILLAVVVFAVPETAYKRFSHNANHSHPTESHQISPHSLKIFNGPFTTESLWQLFWRPIRLLLLPPVLWGTLAQSVCISALVAVTTSSETAFSKTYHWTIWQCGLAYIATIIGALLSIFGSGWLSDTTADWLTRRNHGLREPEMRLPALILCSILCPLGIVLYGLGIEHGLPWIVPVLGLALLGFSAAQVASTALLYAVESHRPIAGEVVVAQMSFKGAFGFLLSFYTNPWIESAGYSTSFGIQAGIIAAVLILWVPLYIWGKRIRAWYMQLSLARYVQWKSDREVGE